MKRAQEVAPGGSRTSTSSSTVGVTAGARSSVLLLPIPGRPGDRGDHLVLAGLPPSKSPAFWPSRSTKIRSATSNTSARLWLITTTP